MGDWDSIFRNKGTFFLKIQEDMEKIGELLKKENLIKVLDLGCGSGRHAVFLSKEGFDVYATDISEEGVRLTKEWLREEGLKANVSVSSCYEKFPFNDESFDAVISTQVIHHNYHEKVKFAISEIERVLRKGGVAFITITAKQNNLNKLGGSKIKVVADQTYMPLDGQETGLPHYVYKNEEAIKEDLNNFDILDIHIDIGDHWCILARKK